MSIERDFKIYGPKQVVEKGKARHPLERDQLMIVIGSTGSGKSQLILNLMEEWSMHAHSKKDFDKIFFYTGSPGDKSLKDLNPKIVQIYGPQTQQSFIDDLVAFESDKRSAEKDGKEVGHSLLILDDASSDKELLSPNLKGSVIGNLIISHRHLGLSVMITSQKFSYVPTLARSNASLFFIYPTKSNPEMKQMCRDLPFSEEVLTNAIRTASSIAHQFVYLNCIERKVFIGFNDCICE